MVDIVSYKSSTLAPFFLSLESTGTHAHGEHTNDNQQMGSAQHPGDWMHARQAHERHSVIV